MGQEPIEVDQLQVNMREKVDMYCYSMTVGLIPREIFVMSKCPDAEDAETAMINVLENVGHKVHLNFTYIATYVLL
jgi:hypothetical protein